MTHGQTLLPQRWLDALRYKKDFLKLFQKWIWKEWLYIRAVSKFRFSISIFDFRGFFPFDFRFPIFEILWYFRFSISEFLKKFEFLAPKMRNSGLSAIINLKNFCLRRRKRKIFGLRNLQYFQNFRLRRWKRVNFVDLVFQNSQNFRLRR